MKKFYLILAAAVGMTITSCTTNDFLGDVDPNAQAVVNDGSIRFGTATKGMTRADHVGADAAGLLGEQFVFAGQKTNATPASQLVFDQYYANWKANTANTTESNSNSWEYVGYTPYGVGNSAISTLPTGSTQTIKYWDYATKQYDFAAYSLGLGADDDDNPSTPNTHATATKIDMDNLTTAAYTLNGSVNELAACYISNLVTAYNRDAVNDYGKTVQFTFRSLGAKVRMALYETVPGYSVKDVKFYTAESPTALATDGTEDVARLFTPSASKILPKGKGTMTVSFPNIGWAKSPNDGDHTDYNKAHVAFAADNAATLSSTLDLAALANFADKDDKETSGSYLGRASNEATYAGGKVGSPAAGKYFTILPYETGTALILRIKYTLVSIDGSGETITVDNASAVVPAEYTKWNPNYAYTYIFKISDYTNGSTGVDGNGATVTGLTPITFDAVVIDSEDGLQETITTVSTPSITTYAKGEVVTANNEYKVDNNIYAVVTNAAGENQTLTVGTNAWLYTVTLEGSSAQVISEATVDNAIANGKYNAAAGTYTVHDANAKDMVVTLNNGLSAISAIPAADSPNGNELTITGAKFTPAATGTYVLRYQTDAPVYDAGTLGSALTAAGVTKLDGYFTYNGSKFVQCDSDAAPSSDVNYYKVSTPGKYMYKVVKVVP